MDKPAISQKIIHYRKTKGITQETLSELTGLNVRTIQRIESGEVDPRLYTLKLIADALGVTLEELLPEPSQHERNQLAVLQITPVAFFLFPGIGNILLPFIYWMLKKEEVPGISKYGRQLMNAQLTYSIVAGIFMMTGIVMALAPMLFPSAAFPQVFFMHYPIYFFTGMVLSLIVFVLLPAINAYRVYHGEPPMSYPLAFAFFK